MSIIKKMGITLGTLALIAGGSLAVVSASAQSKMFDSKAAQFIASEDLAGYKSYLTNQKSTRINAIDQTIFDQIKLKYQAQKPLLDLNAKYEPKLIELASKNDESGFVILFTKYQIEAKPIFESIKMNKSKKVNTSTEIKELDTNSSEERLNKKATKEFNRAVKKIAKGQTYSIHPKGLFGKETKSNNSSIIL